MARPRSEAEAPGTLTDIQRAEFSLLKNIRYHEDRESHFAFWNRTFDLFVLLTGTATFAALSNVFPETIKIDGRWLAALTSLIGAIRLVFALGRKEHIHGDLRKRFLKLYPGLLDGDIAGTRKKMHELFPDEPPTFHAVDSLAFNAAMTALNRPENLMLRVTWLRRRARNYLRFEGVRFRRVGETQQSREGLAWWQRPKV